MRGGQLKYHVSIELLRKSFLADVDDFRVIFGNEHDSWHLLSICAKSVWKFEWQSIFQLN